MKKYFLSLGLIVAAMFTLTNCTEQIDAPVEPAKVPFEIIASTAETKTTNDGMSTEWSADDAINLFHQADGDGDDYTSDGKFELYEDKVFKGELAGTLVEGTEYNWYALYPYSSYVNTPAATKSGYVTVGSGAKDFQTQTGNNSMSHIAGPNYPLAGVLKNNTYSSVNPINIEMSHLTSLLEIVVTNKNEEELTVETISFTGTENIVGTYYINFAAEPVVYTSSGDSYVSKVARLNVENGASIIKDASAKFYIAIKPFTAAKGSKLRLTVNGYSKEITLEEAAVTFSAGKVKTLNFAYDEVKLPAQSIPWSEDFSSQNVSSYKLVHGGSDTKIYEDNNLAGGEAPELLIGKNGGSMTVKFSAEEYNGKRLSLLFKTNKADCLEVLATGGVELQKENNSEYTVVVSEEVVEFSLTLKNIDASTNARVDDIELDVYRTPQAITFETSSYALVKGSAEYSSFVGQNVTGNHTPVTYTSSNESVATVNAETGAITLMNTAGTAKITATAKKTETYRSATATYTITVSEANVSGGRADIETVKATTSYGTYNTTTGWIGTNCNVLSGGTTDSNPKFICIGTEDDRAFCMNGKTSAIGKIESPKLNGGCGKLSFDYAYVYSESNGVKFKVEILQNDEVVKTITPPC